ncbi:hypothetical protein GLOIN_2v1844700 [Rhizophagus irregularis DAOM 181602=DAOM 197198]|uniref:Uncharacterized protein n=1 Tax=Rhizophagus irregularis (strain DAOM 181602 / DAOM 197198 / MUCL 43194) TaxID=747089 RepID=A0A2P4PJC6_RHIID|nr:hypothetical protein GLOIN_2v1844700 [Rhizophagus irregularis DAOM 181602=DAOM 197198]POG65496.1 hypothetical protein GLOIN_2v1844700 [Rhizophagus irregularis DAOM 181602=DAOM 197198]|eukprot:XP_025172362.1 hypothetical protein GLOIN_2v1844700 [Rhizophagus irregularis DAOM 181602=DAOM 197198]
MTDYDPYNDFWGDFLTGVVVTIIATRISDKTKDENDGCNNKKTKKKNYLDILDDFIIFGSLHAMNIYYFFKWWRYENKFTKAFGVIIFIYSIFFLFFAIFFNVKDVKDEKKRGFMRGHKCLILFITALLFFVNPSSIKQIEVPNEFSMNKNFHKNCEELPANFKGTGLNEPALWTIQNRTLRYFGLDSDMLIWHPVLLAFNFGCWFLGLFQLDYSTL